MDRIKATIKNLLRRLQTPFTKRGSQQRKHNSGHGRGSKSKSAVNGGATSFPRFLDLPTEIRLMIYDRYFEVTTDGRWKSIRVEGVEPPQATRHNIPLSLTLCNRQLRWEALPRAGRNAILEISSHWNGHLDAQINRLPEWVVSGSSDVIISFEYFNPRFRNLSNFSRATKISFVVGLGTFTDMLRFDIMRSDLDNVLHLGEIIRQQLAVSLDLQFDGRRLGTGEYSPSSMHLGEYTVSSRRPKLTVTTMLRLFVLVEGGVLLRTTMVLTFGLQGTRRRPKWVPVRSRIKRDEQGQDAHFEARVMTHSAIAWAVEACGLPALEIWNDPRLR